MTKFTRNIKEIQDNNEFFDFDYNDLLENFDTNNETDEKDNVSFQLSVINIAFIDSIRGPISRPKFIDRLLTGYRREWIEDIKARLPGEGDKVQ